MRRKMETHREATEPVGLRVPRSVMDEVRALMSERGEYQDRTVANAMVRLLRKGIAAERAESQA